MSDARYGWYSDLHTFVSAKVEEIVISLESFVQSPSTEQADSWKKSVKWLQREYEHCIREDQSAYGHSTILEYELPRDLRRPDVIVLQTGVVIVLEVKGRVGFSQAAIDQVGAYARDLVSYHRACQNTKVVPLLVPVDGPESAQLVDGVWVVGPKGVHQFLLSVSRNSTQPAISKFEFLDEDAYSPLPSIVQAARDLYNNNPLPRIKRARAETEPAIKSISAIAHQAAKSKTRHLVLLSGVPGSGKTLVGLQTVHSGWLDDLSVDRKSGKPSLPAVYLSGNGPLVQVLQHALKSEAGDGKVFVQPIKSYVSYHMRKTAAIPPEHVVIFDEAQRAHDEARVAHVHNVINPDSEPAQLIKIGNRTPEWNVIVALIGSGQAIHVGEEGGIALWCEALEKTGANQNWTVHAASALESELGRFDIDVCWNETLNLDTEIRFHLTPRVHEYVDALVNPGADESTLILASELWKCGHRFLVTRNLEIAKNYMIERYQDAPEARYGMLASSKDKWLFEFGMDNNFQTTKRLKVGPWFNSPKFDPESCCQLDTLATEFASQGLELDFALLGWGSDLIWEGGDWSMKYSRGTRGHVQDPMQLRKNVYRVLLTRGRDGTVVYVPEIPKLDATFNRLMDMGFRALN